MKKVILTLCVGLFTAAAFAQTTTPATAAADKKQDMKDLRKDVRDERHDKQLKTYEVKHGDKAEAKAETKNIKADKKDINGDVKDLRGDGVKHPLKHADRQIHRQNMHHKH
jgi:Ni/Co efflux regulator RcnB